MSKLTHLPTNNGFSFIATDDVGVIGCCLCSFEQDASLTRNLVIDWLWVDKSKRRHGIGLELLQAVCSQADELDLLWISFWTGSGSHHHTTLFKTAGFKEMCRLGDYYADGHPTLLYARRRP